MFSSIKIQAQPLTFDEFFEGIQIIQQYKLEDLGKEYKLYAQTAKTVMQIPSNIVMYWIGIYEQFPILPGIAKCALQYPISNCAVERSFSQFRYIFSERRRIKNSYVFRKQQEIHNENFW